MLKITPTDIKYVIQFIYNISGISLDEKKAYLIETRLSRLVEEYGCSSYTQLCQKAQAEEGGALERKIIDNITTNETLFFRDNSPFEMFRHKIMPDLIDRKSSSSSTLLSRDIRIWSAACSTGQEIYSLAIVLKELLPNLNKYNIKMLGTDISDEAIAQASYGRYSKFEIERGLGKDKLQKYFEQNGSSWKIRDDIRAMAMFKKINLMESLTGLGKFDIIFCRNVAIYFSQEDKKKLYEKIANALEPDGYLVIGSTESLTGISTLFEPKRHLRAIFYQRKQS